MEYETVLIQSIYMPKGQSFLWGIWYLTHLNVNQEEFVKSQQELFKRLKKYKDKSIRQLIITGHGLGGLCGVSHLIDLDRLTDEEIAILEQKLDPDATIELWACWQANSARQKWILQRFANRVGRKVRATTGRAYTPLGGSTDKGIRSGLVPSTTDGEWLEFPPGKPIPESPPADIDAGEPKKPGKQ